MAHPWSEWINEKYEEFRKGKRGNAASVSAFGRMFGAPHQVVLNWLREDATPPREKRYIERIVEIFGDEAYPALGVPKPATDESGQAYNLTENEKKALEYYRSAPVEYQEDLLILWENFLLRHGFRRVK